MGPSSPHNQMMLQCSEDPHHTLGFKGKGRHGNSDKIKHWLESGILWSRCLTFTACKSAKKPTHPMYRWSYAPRPRTASSRSTLCCPYAHRCSPPLRC